MKTTNVCGGVITVFAWISLIGGLLTAFFTIGGENPEVGMMGLYAALSSPFTFGFAKIVKAAHIYIEKNADCDTGNQNKPNN